jgi:thiol-disulfide isomerase/thioredoxin
MMVLALALVLNLDRRFQTFILTYAPQYGAGLTSFENNQLVQNQLDALQGRSSQKIVVGLQPQGSPAPEITEESWINSSPLALSQLKGKVVLVDFWTYSCINCIRTFPYLKKWYETYKDLGLVIVGVHSPEFEFEKDRQNVVQAVQDFGLTYPVVQDNDFEIWNRYSNRYWPAHYLIDAKGEIRYTHFGEGAYAETEAAIRALLEEAGEPVPSPVVTPDIGGGTRGLSPETYLGLSRLERFASKPSPTSPGEYKFEIYDQIPLHAFGYQGGWNLESESAQAGEQAALEMEFRAKQVFLVLTPASKSDVVTVMLDGQVVSTQQAGKDVTNGQVTVDEPRLYELILLDEVGQHRLRLEFLQPGTKVFAFTFG